MRLIRVLLPFALIAAAASIALAKPYVSPKGYQITPAAGWQVNSQGLMGANLVIIASSSDGFRANLTVIVRPMPQSMGPKQLREIANEELQKLKDYKQVSQRDIVVDGADGLSTSAEYQTNPTFFMHEVVVIKNRTIYTFTCTVLSTNHAKYEAAFASMLKSIKWHAPKAGAISAGRAKIELDCRPPVWYNGNICSV
jgi:hypothetical protein